MSDPFLTPSFRGSHIAMPDVRERSASVIQIESSKLLPAVILIGLLSGIAVAVSVVNSFATSEKARLMERETRLMQDDLKYIRAYLSARGIKIPVDHDQAEQESER